MLNNIQTLPGNKPTNQYPSIYSIYAFELFSTGPCVDSVDDTNITQFAFSSARKHMIKLKTQLKKLLSKQQQIDTP